MFQNIDQALTVYKKKVKEHWGWIQEVKKTAEEECEKKGIRFRGLADLSKEDKEIAILWVQILTVMQQVLGLSKEEADQIMCEVAPEIENLLMGPKE